MKNLFRNSFKHALKKCSASILATAIVSGTVLSGSAGIVNVQAAENKAIALPIDFIGVSDRFGAEWESSTRCHFNGNSQIGTFSDNYTYSYTCYIPKAVFDTAGSTVKLDCWLDLMAPSETEGEDDTWLGNVQSKYDIALIYEKGQVRFGILNRENDWQLVEDANEYASFLSLDTVGDFYKVTMQNAPISNVLYGENEETQVDTSRTGYVTANINLTGVYNLISSIAYVDDVVIKAGSNTVIDTDCSDESLESIAHYEYVIAENDDARVERPAACVLNTSLLTLGKSSGKVKVGKTLSINATAAASTDITYTSSNKKIATVDAKGKVKGIKAGSANITVSANGISKTYKVTVKK